MVIGLLLGFLQTLISPFGMLFFLMGVVMFALLPMVPRVTNYWHVFARFHLGLGAQMLKRASIVVSEHGDLLLKRMHPDDIGTETVDFDEDTKEFEDQNERKAKSSWAGIPFALADEVHGFLFTPVDAALGARKASAEKHDEMIAKATESERSKYDVQGWARGVFSFPKGKHELVDLNMVRQIVTGSERAEHPQRVETFYENSREPYQDGKGVAQYIAIIIAMIGPFAAIWILSSQLGLGFGGGGGGGGGAAGNVPDDNVSYGVLFLAISLQSLGQLIKSVDWKRVAVSAVVLGTLPALYVLILLIGGPVYATMLFIIMGMGFWLLPILFQLLKVSDRLTNSVAGLLLKSGFMGYDTPVFEYTARGYETREFSKLDVDEDNVVWHTFLGRTFGFTFSPDATVWGDAAVEADDLRDRAEVVADNGDEVLSGIRTNIPSGFRRIPERTRAVYGNFVPRQIHESRVYVKTGIALERMKNVATGQKSHRRLTQAKEEYGSITAGEDAKMRQAVMVSAGLSMLAGIAVLVVPALV